MKKRLILAFLLAAALLPLAAYNAAPQANDAASLANLRWRSIGPANPGGRVTDIVGVPGDPNTYYVAGAVGGIFKTTNGGMTFTPIFDNQEVSSIGAVALAPSNPNVIWVGTGEGDPRNDAGFGDGVYRSADGGQTWQHVGLTDTERIKRIRVHPTDPNTAWIAALGHEWGPNEERGVFKTTDAGKTWKRVLYLDADTGCSDIDIDSRNPSILYAGMYTYRRRPWRFDSGSGRTALYRSKDGGETWDKLIQGLPKTPMDRIGVAVAPSNPNTVYMITETKIEGNLFRSDDRGDTWRMVLNNPNINFRPFYYSDLRVDPNNPERVYSLGGSLMMSIDGGRTFSSIAQGVHSDHQALWIDPKNSNYVLSGSDGGFQVSLDGGRTWEVINNISFAQFYHITYDLQVPYLVYGGLQDNGCWVGPSATMFSNGIRKRDWYTIGGSDGFFAVPDLNAPHLVYTDLEGGSITLLDRNSGVSRNVTPYPKDVGPTGSPIFNYRYRFNWNPPIAASPQNPSTIYFGAQVIFKTTNQGYSWEIISPDLSTNDKSKQQSSGGEIVTDNTAAEFHCTILTIAESPVRAGVIWAGTDDGNIQVTQDGGKKWTNTIGNIKGLAPNPWIPTIEASHYDAGTAYVAVDRHQDNDFAPYAYKTTDYGQTWTSIRGDLPGKGYVHVVREDPKVKNLLYLGTELGIFASWDDGGHWVPIRNNMPPVAVRDIAIHPRDNDMIVGTHGRGAYILDNITPLQQLAQARASDAFLFDIQPAMRRQLAGRDGSVGAKDYGAPNPPYGAAIDYYLRAATTDQVSITITDKAGKAMRTFRNQTNRAGVNRVIWDLRIEGPQAAPGGAPGTGPAAGAPGAGGRGGGGRGGGGSSPQVVPGEYNVVLQVGSKQMSKPARVVLDPKVKVSAADLQAQSNTAQEVQALSVTVTGLVNRVEDLTRQLTSLSDPARRPALDQLNQLHAKLVRECTMSYRCGAKLRENVNSLLGSVTGTIARPSDGMLLLLREYKEEAAQAAADLNAIVSTSIKKEN
ncbi:MAG: hypothetical protein LAP85_21455 [Acidobacteriia bacterium]|nr:hypothetical protein [Terriglobia bacterium]